MVARAHYLRKSGMLVSVGNGRTGRPGRESSRSATETSGTTIPRRRHAMGIADDAVEIRSQGWRTLAAVHGLIEAALDKALQREHELSIVEYTVLDALSRQDGWHMRMQQLARAAALSASATTRLVTRLENRGLLTRILCADDRRGIYTELTPAGRALLEKARPLHDEVLRTTLDEAREVPELAGLVNFVSSVAAS
jgi:DNA-binding MarR family transcriptional regulator